MTVISGIIGGITGSNAASDASEAQLQATRETIEAYREMFDISMELQEPFRQGGLWALNQLIGTPGTEGYWSYPEASSGTSAYGGGYTNALAVNPSLTNEQQKAQLLGKAPMLIGGYTPGPDYEKNWRQAQPKPYTGRGGQNKGTYQDWEQEMIQNAALFGPVSGPNRNVGGLIGTGGSGGTALQPTWVPGTEGTEGLLGGGAPELDFDSFKDSPWYTLQRDEGLKSLQSTAAGQGLLQSGNTGKALMKFGSDYAYGKALDVHQQQTSDWINTKLNPLLSILGSGQVSAGQQANNAISTGSQIGAAETYGGEAAASGYLGQASSWQNALSGISDTTGTIGTMALANKMGIFK